MWDNLYQWSEQQEQIFTVSHVQFEATNGENFWIDEFRITASQPKGYFHKLLIKIKKHEV